MKIYIVIILIAFFSTTLRADIPGNKPRPATHATILLPTNGNGWQWRYYGSGVSGKLLTTINVITIPGGGGRPSIVEIFAIKPSTGEQTEPISLWGGSDYFLVIDSASEKKIYYKSVNEGEFLRLTKPIKSDTSNTVKTDTGSYNIEDKATIKYYIADGPGPSLIAIPVLFVLVTMAIIALIVFMYKRYTKK